MTDLPEKEIQSLLNRIAQGDDQAVSRLYLHYQRGLYAFIRMRVADDSDAEEILHDTFMVVIKKPLSFNATSKFSTWLCAIAKNKTLDWWRRKERMTEMVGVEDDEIEAVPDEGLNMDALLEQEEVNQVLYACMERLKMEHREVIHYTYFEQESVESIAQKMECPAGTIKSRLYHARLKILECMKKAWGTELKHV